MDTSDDDYQLQAFSTPEGGWKLSMTIKTLSGRKPFWSCDHVHATQEEAENCRDRPDLT
jgi:hypothetical protein